MYSYGYQGNNMYHSPPSLESPLPLRNRGGPDWIANAGTPGPFGQGNQLQYGPGEYNMNSSYYQEGYDMNTGMNQGFVSGMDPGAQYFSHENYTSPPILPSWHHNRVPVWLEGIPDGQQASPSSSELVASFPSPPGLGPGSNTAPPPSRLFSAPSPAQIRMAAAEFHSGAGAAGAPSMGFPATPNTYHPQYPAPATPGFPQFRAQTRPVVANGSNGTSVFNPSEYAAPVEGSPELEALQRDTSVPELQILSESSSDDDGLGFEMYKPDYEGLTLAPSHPRRENPVERPASCPLFDVPEVVPLEGVSTVSQ
jgi:hypothetical protein